MRYALPIVIAVLSLACASMTERIVNDARQGLVWDADYAPIDGGDPKVLAAFYSHVTNTLGIAVHFLPANHPALNGAYGTANRYRDTLLIRMRGDLSVNATIEVLAHEAAHLMQPPYLTRSEGDIFAEIVSAHVAKRLGVPNAAKTSALWLRQHKPSLRMALDLQNEIEYVAKMLMPGSGARVVDVR